MGNSLALCMMVKNEEHFLSYCLASVHKYCDEIIIVDTGSTDNTVAIAKAFGAIVIQTGWYNDFSLIRNIAQAPATSDWILWLDADEVFTDAGINKIKNQLLYDDNVDFYLMPRLNFWKSTQYISWYPDSQWKIYRNNIGLKWTGKIHEKIYDEHNQQHRRRLKNTDVHIYHYAYMKTKEEVQKKLANYIKIENPNMEDAKINRCSTEHSFFYDKLPDGTTEFNGQLPETMDRVKVTEDEVIIEGKTFLKFSEKKPEQQVVVDNRTDELVEYISTLKNQLEKIKPLAREIYSTLNDISAEGKSLIQYSEMKKEQKQESIIDTSAFVPDLISFVIVSYNKIEYVRPLVRDLFNSVHSPFEIIIVDNGSTELSVNDYLVEIVQQHQNVRYIRLDNNLGFAKGYNAGVKETKGEWVCVLNNDILPTDYFAEKMINFLKDDKEVAMVGPVSNNIYGENQMVVAPHGSSFGDYLQIIEKFELSNEQRRVYSSWLTGCVLMFKRDLLAQLATITTPPRNGLLFCEDFPVGCGEDSDLDFAIQHRLHKKLGVEKTAFVWHHGNKTLETVSSDWRNEIQAKNDKILRQRWPEIFPNG